MNKVWQISIKKIAEFNYKLLHRIITCRHTVSKWKRDITPNCIYCDHIETVKHMLFDCSHVHKIWEKVGIALITNITWKHVVIGYYNGVNRHTMFRNILFSLIAFCIYKAKVLNDIAIENDKAMKNISHSMKKEFAHLIYCFQYMKGNVLSTFHNEFMNIYNIL
jgi:hypothetical protein